MDVLLVAAVVGLVDNFLLSQAAVVGDVEEVAEVSADAELAALLFDEFSKDDDAIAALRTKRLVFKFGRIFSNEALVEVAAVTDDFFLETSRPGTLASEQLAGLAAELGEVGWVDLLGPVHEGRVGVVSEHEAHTGFVPVIEMSGHREVCVAAQQNVSRASASAQGDGLVECGRSALERRTIAATVEYEERLARVSQRNQQRVITPDTLVGEVHALLALASRGHQRPIGVDTSRFVGQRSTALFPDV